MKSAVIVDSVAYLPKELANHPDIFQIDLAVNFHDGSVMKDSSNDDEIAAFYSRLKTESQLPTTTQPPVGDYYELMDRIVEKGYEVVYCIHLSAGISGTYQSAVMVTNEYQDKIITYCIDSKGASVGMQALASAALDMIQQNEPHEDIAQKLHWLVEHSRIYLMVEDLNNFAKGGRLSTTSALLGGVLQIRPLLYFDDEGKIVLFEKIRTNKRVYKRWLELLEEAVQKYPKGVDIAFAHGDVAEEIEEIAAMMREKFPTIKITVSLLGPVVGTHTGKGAKGLGIFPNIQNYDVM